MLCEICQKNQATFHYTEVVNGVKNEHHLSGECAAHTDISYYSSVFDNEQFEKLLSGIFGSSELFAGGEKEDPAKNVLCPNCKMTYGEFIANSTFGCPDCYDVFGPLIATNIKKIQGSDTHVGKKPMLYSTKSVVTEGVIPETLPENDIHKEIDYYSKKLKEAVNEEDYEEAARLRDLIAELKGRV